MLIMKLFRHDLILGGHPAALTPQAPLARPASKTTTCFLPTHHKAGVVRVLRALMALQAPRVLVDMAWAIPHLAGFPARAASSRMHLPLGTILSLAALPAAHLDLQACSTSSRARVLTPAMEANIVKTASQPLSVLVVSLPEAQLLSRCPPSLKCSHNSPSTKPKPQRLLLPPSRSPLLKRYK